MSFNTFGKIFRFTTWGESHGPAIGCVVDGCPPNIPLSVKDIQIDMDRRRPGKSKFTSQRKEFDKVEILSGTFNGKTTGTPISMIIYNRDAKSRVENRDVPLGEGISLVRDMFVAETMEEAKKLAGEHIVNYMRWVCHWRGLGNHMDPGEELPETKNKLDLLNYEFLHKRNLLFGTPDFVIKKIKELQQELNLQSLQVWSNFPGVKHEDSMRSIKLFTEEVIPKINSMDTNIQRAS